VSAEPTPTSTFDLSFPHSWQAEILAARPLILPPRHFVYPREAEEVERGALEVLVRPFSTEHAAETRRDLKGHGFSRVGYAAREMPALATEGMQEPKAFRQGLKPQTPLGGPVDAAEAAPFQIGERDPAGVPSVTTRAQFERFPQEPFLATCALGFRDAAVPSGLWACPDSQEMCAVSGGYAYIIDTSAPERFTMIPYRPVLEVRVALETGLLLFVGHHSILAWGAGSRAWESEKLSDEGVAITAIEGGLLRGTGWNMRSDKETAFTLDLGVGLLV